MQTKHVYLNDLHFEHSTWLRELAFYSEELDILENRLAEVALKNTNDDIRNGVIDFQNRFVTLRNSMEVCKEQTQNHEHSLSEFAQDHPIAIEHRYFEDHTDLRDKMHDVAASYAAIKKDFMRFVSANM